MGSSQITVRPVTPFQLAHTDDPRDRVVIGQWKWYEARLDAACLSWNERVDGTRGMVEALINELRQPGLDAVLYFYGQVLPDGLIAVCNALIDADSGARFYIPPIENMASGKGYVTSFFTIEYKMGFITRLFERAPCALGGNENHLSVYFVPKQSFDEVAQCRCGLHASVQGPLRHNQRRLLELCVFAMFVNTDFDVVTMGATLDHVELLLSALRK